MKSKNFFDKNIALGQKLRMVVRSWSYTPLIMVILSTMAKKILFFIFGPSHLFLNIQISLDMFWKALDLGFRINNIHDISSRIFRRKNQTKEKKNFKYFLLCYHSKFLTEWSTRLDLILSKKNLEEIFLLNFWLNFQLIFLFNSVIEMSFSENNFSKIASCS